MRKIEYSNFISYPNECSLCNYGKKYDYKFYGKILNNVVRIEDSVNHRIYFENFYSALAFIFIAIGNEVTR